MKSPVNSPGDDKDKGKKYPVKGNAKKKSKHDAKPRSRLARVEDVLNARGSDNFTALHFA